MSGWRVDHSIDRRGDTTTTTWHTNEATAVREALLLGNAIAWFDAETVPVDRGPYDAARYVRDALVARVAWLRLEEVA